MTQADNISKLDERLIPGELMQYIESEQISSIEELVLPNSMDGDGPLVSVIIPTYEDSQYLTKALYSVGNQTYNNLEVILVDGSDIRMLERLATDYDWIQYLSSPVKGVSAARNDGIERSSGEIIALLDADDYWHPKKIEKQVSLVESGENVVYSDYINIDAKNSERSTSYVDGSPHQCRDLVYLGRFFDQIPVQTSTLLFSRSVISNRPFKESVRYGEDTLLMFELFKNHPPAHISEPLSVRRKRTGSLQSSIDGSYKNTSNLLEYYTNNYPELKPAFETWFGKRDAYLGKRHIRGGDRLAGRKHLKRSIKLNGKKVDILIYYIISFFPINRLRYVLNN